MENKKTILIAEDDKQLQLLFKEILEVNGYAVVTADNGVEAAMKYIDFSPDLVIMDIIMPKMDGLESYRIIKEFDKDARVIFLTCQSYENEKYQKIKNEELVVIITKPIGMNALLQLAKKY